MTRGCADKSLYPDKLSLAERSQVGLFITSPITDTSHEGLNSLIHPNGTCLIHQLGENSSSCFGQVAKAYLFLSSEIITYLN